MRIVRKKEKKERKRKEKEEKEKQEKEKAKAAAYVWFIQSGCRISLIYQQIHIISLLIVP